MARCLFVGQKDLALRGKGQNSQLVFLMADANYLTGRPHKTEGKRTKKIDVRFTEDEFKIILELETSLGMSKTDLIRMRLLDNAKNVVIDAKELIRSLDAVGAEMGRAGNNINQLAKHANILNLSNSLSPEVVSDFNMQMLNYNRLQRELEIALRKIMRQMAN